MKTLPLPLSLVTKTLYLVHVDDNYTLLKRYSQFRNLHKQLEHKYREETNWDLPNLPPKLARHNHDDIQARLAQLDAYLTALISIHQLKHETLIQKFLAPPNQPQQDQHLIPSQISDTDSELPTPLKSSTVDSEEAAPRISPCQFGAEGEQYFASRLGLGEDEFERQWRLDGTWVADEARSRDTLDSMMKELGVGYLARLMMSKQTYINRYDHRAGELHEYTSSSLGPTQHVVHKLDGEERQVQTPLGAASRSCTQKCGDVIIVTKFGTGRLVTDTRRVLSSGHELERLLRIETDERAPVILHRLLMRQPGSCDPVPFECSGGGGERESESERVGDGLKTSESVNEADFAGEGSATISSAGNGHSEEMDQAFPSRGVAKSLPHRVVPLASAIGVTVASACALLLLHTDSSGA